VGEAGKKITDKILTAKTRRARRIKFSGRNFQCRVSEGAEKKIFGQGFHGRDAKGVVRL